MFTFDPFFIQRSTIATKRRETLSLFSHTCSSSSDLRLFTLLLFSSVGATGAVGLEVVKCLHARQAVFGGSPPDLYASPRSAGKVLETPYGGLTITAFDLEAVNAKKYSFVFLAVSGGFSLANAIPLTNGGATYVIDNSSAYRYDDSVPLIVPEINMSAVSALNSKLIANPNCTTAIAAMALHPIHVKYGIKTLIVSSYQVRFRESLPEGTRPLRLPCPFPSASLSLSEK